MVKKSAETEENVIYLNLGESSSKLAQKKKDNSADYSRNKIKRARIHGKAYVTTKNKAVQANT